MQCHRLVTHIPLQFGTVCVNMYTGSRERDRDEIEVWHQEQGPYLARAMNYYCLVQPCDHISTTHVQWVHLPAESRIPPSELGHQDYWPGNHGRTLMHQCLLEEAELTSAYS